MKKKTYTIPANLNVTYIDSVSSLKELKKEVESRMWALAFDCTYSKDAPSKKEVTERINKTLELIDNYVCNNRL